MLYLSVIFLTTIPIFLALPPPSYVKTCKLDDPNFKKCALENANYAIPFIVKGDKEYKIPPINPLHLPLLKVEDKNFAITLKEVDVNGFEDMKVEKIDLDKTSIDILLHCDKLDILGDYSVDTKILLLALKGEGRINITAIGGDYHFTAGLKSLEKHGETYYQLNEPHLDFTLQQAYFHLDNLFNGDKRLGDETNKFVNDNWREVINELGKPISEAVVTVITTIVNNIIKNVPEKTLFQ